MRACIIAAECGPRREDVDGLYIEQWYCHPAAYRLPVQTSSRSTLLKPDSCMSFKDNTRVLPKHSVTDI